MDIVFPGQPVEDTIGSGNMPSNFDIKLYRGDAFEFFVELRDDTATIDLTGYTPSMEFKTSYEQEAGVTINTSIVMLDGVNHVRIYIPSSQSRTLNEDYYIYDLQIANINGDSRTFLTGDVQMLSQVTNQ